MTPMLMCLEPWMVQHDVVRSGKVDPIHYIHTDPFHPSLDDCDRYLAWANENQHRPRLAQFGWLGVEGFSIDVRGDEVTNPDGTKSPGPIVEYPPGKQYSTTANEFTRGMAGGGFKKVFDTQITKTIGDYIKASPPQFCIVDHEPNTTPPYTDPLISRARFDQLRFDHIYNILRDAGLLSQCKNVVIEFTQFASDTDPMAWDFNAQRVPFNKPISRRAPGTLNYVKAGSSSEFYSVDNTTVVKLAAWLAACAPGAFPILQPANTSMLQDQLDICNKYKATPVIYCNPVFGGSIDWQMDRLGEALVG